MEKIKVLDVVKNTTAKFIYASCGVLYYEIIADGYTYQFPIDMNKTEDVGTTKFEAEYKSLTLMRYVRKSIEDGSIVYFPNKKEVV